MNAQQLNALLARHGVGVDDWRGGAGKFRDLVVGVGRRVRLLESLRSDLRKAGVMAYVGIGSNREHPDYGKFYLEIPSFWWEE